MRDGSQKKSKHFWSKTMVRKWFNIKSKAEDFRADHVVEPGEELEWVRTSFSDREVGIMKKSKTERSSRKNPDRVRRAKIDLDAAHVTDTQSYKIFVATWNVGGKSPSSSLSLEDWLHTSPPADIYVVGFQEIVPLNAGNVLGAEDNGPARKWLALIRRTLNSLPDMNHAPSPVELDSDFEGSVRQKATSFVHRRSFQSLSRSMQMDNDISVSQPRWGGSSNDENDCTESPHTTGYFSPLPYSVPAFEDGQRSTSRRSRYCLLASKQMVGIYLMVWVRNELRDDCKNLKVSCVGRGLMGYLGNKGSISISISLHQTSFCFVCSHLTSGQKEGDELRRNADVMEILRKTRFPRVHGLENGNLPETILDHDRIIWLGDLNYRIALSYHSAKALVEMHNWRALLENDQLRIEQNCGRVFEGWSEGKIYFLPTYKYSNNSDRYAGDDYHLKEKRRTPAWCDRILWYGRGLNQLSYVRGESRFSDHRPVYSVFLAEVESFNRSRIKKSTSSRIEVEELLPHTHGYNELNFF